MKIVLINAPVARQSSHARISPPLGLAYIASALFEAGHSVTAVDYNISGLNLQRVDRLIERNKPGIIGISAHTETYPNAIRIAERIKSLAPEVKIVLGGPHPSILPEDVLAEKAVDFIVVGEGEATMTELANHLEAGDTDFSSIAGLGYKDSDGIGHLNPRRELLNPDELPFPARDIFPLEFYKEPYNVLAARGGCPFRCPFCSASFIWSGKRRARTPKNLITEIKMLQRQGANYVFFADDIFTLDKKWVYEVLEELKTLDYPLDWGCATRVDMVDPQLLKDMAALGCRAIQYGVESGCQKILDSVKGIKKDQVIEAVKAAKEVEIEVASSFMIPFPEDTKETIRETKDFMKEVFDAGSKILLSYTSPYPGTYFYMNAENLGLEILATNWEEFDAKHNVLKTKYLSTSEIESLVDEIVRELGLKKASS